MKSISFELVGIFGKSALFAALIVLEPVHAQSPLVSIQTVTIGDPGNTSDTRESPIGGTNYFGAVSETFAIGKYEVTIGQYATFLSSVASVTSDNDIVNLWNPNMASDLNVAGISRSGSGTLASPYSYSVIGNGNRPIAYVSWFDAARFANWMNNGATDGASTETGAYTLNGATSGIITKSAGATWWIPSENQWYKAAYYKGGGTNAGYWLYPTMSDTAPANVVGGDTNSANYRTSVFSVTQSSNYSSAADYLTTVGTFSNSQSSYGTLDQGGNVFEWNDAVIDGITRGVRGGSWNLYQDTLQAYNRDVADPGTDQAYIGFRLATVPEPSTHNLIFGSGLIVAALFFLRRKRDR